MKPNILPVGGSIFHSRQDRLLGAYLNEWVKKAEVDGGKRAGLPSDVAEKMKALERTHAVMIQLTAFGTRGGGGSVNQYDAASNGNLDDDEPLLEAQR
jgi:hypothetical protein